MPKYIHIIKPENPLPNFQEGNMFLIIKYHHFFSVDLTVYHLLLYL